MHLTLLSRIESYIISMLFMMFTGTRCLTTTNQTPAEDYSVSTFNTTWSEVIDTTTSVPATGENLVKAAEEGHLRTVHDLTARGVDVDAFKDGRHSHILCVGLMRASRYEKWDVVNFLLDDGVMNEVNNVCKADLARYAAQFGQTQLMERLLQTEIKPNMERGSLLRKAVTYTQPKIVKILLDAGAYPDAQDPAEKDIFMVTPLKTAADFNRLEIVDLLIEAGARVNLPTDCYFDVAQEAAGKGHLEVIKKLVEAGYDPTICKGQTLKSAAAYGHLKMVEILLAAGGNPNGVDPQGNEEDVIFRASPMVDAVLANRSDVVPVLLEAGGYLNFTGIRLEYLASQAARNGFYEVLERLLDFGFDPNSDDERALREAAQFGHHKIVKTLLAAGASPDIVRHDEERGEIVSDYTGLPLKLACDNNHLAVVNLLLEAGARVHFITRINVAEGAAKKGHLQIIKRLLEAEFNPDLNNGETLRWAVEEKQLDVIHALLEAGADVSKISGDLMSIATEASRMDIIEILLEAGATDFGAAIDYAAKMQHYENITFLLEKGADPNDISVEHMMRAAINNDLKFAKFFLEAGYNVSKTIVLHYAVVGGHEEMVTLLLDYGSNVNKSIDSYSELCPDYCLLRDLRLLWQPLHVAAYHGKFLIQLLMERGANINAIDFDRNTPLHVAIERQRKLDIVKELVKFCPDMTRTNYDGLTPLDLAKEVAARQFPYYYRSLEANVMREFRRQVTRIVEGYGCHERVHNHTVQSVNLDDE